MYKKMIFFSHRCCCGWCAFYFVYRIIMTVDEKMNNAASYRVHREDHTLGHLLRM